MSYPASSRCVANGMPEGMTRHALCQTRAASGLCDSALDHRLVQVKARRRPVALITADPARRKHKLAEPLRRRVRKFALQGSRQHDASEARRQIRLVEATNDVEMLS